MKWIDKAVSSVTILFPFQNPYGNYIAEHDGWLMVLSGCCRAVPAHHHETDTWTCTTCSGSMEGIKDEEPSSYSGIRISTGPFNIRRWVSNWTGLDLTQFTVSCRPED